MGTFRGYRSMHYRDRNSPSDKARNPGPNPKRGHVPLPYHYCDRVSLPDSLRQRMKVGSGDKALFPTTIESEARRRIAGIRAQGLVVEVEAVHLEVKALAREAKVFSGLGNVTG